MSAGGVPEIPHCHTCRRACCCARRCQRLRCRSLLCSFVELLIFVGCVALFLALVCCACLLRLFVALVCCALSLHSFVALFRRARLSRSFVALVCRARLSRSFVALVVASGCGGGGNRPQTQGQRCQQTHWHLSCQGAKSQ